MFNSLIVVLVEYWSQFNENNDSKLDELLMIEINDFGPIEMFGPT